MLIIIIISKLEAIVDSLRETATSGDGKEKEELQRKNLIRLLQFFSPLIIHLQSCFSKQIECIAYDNQLRIELNTAFG